jgi:hypothetical protein
MKKVVMTKQMVQDYFSRMKDRKSDPNYPFCRICSKIVFFRGKHISAKSDLKYFHVGETVYQVTYPNGQKGFYHIACVDGPQRKDRQMMVEEILRYDVDKWNGLEDFIRDLVEKKTSDKQIIEEVGLKFNCSRTTAWRRLRRFKSHTD